MKDSKIFLKKRKEKNDNMVVNVTNNSQKIKNRSLLSIEKNIMEWEKCYIIIVRNHFNLENFASL